MKTTKTKKFYLIFIFGVICINLCFPMAQLTTAQNQTGQGAKKFEGTMVCRDKKVVTDDQWQWYKCIVDLDEKVYVYLSYKGDLDLDLRMYWKRENPPDFNGFDLTHCSMNTKKFNISDNSQLRTTNTHSLGEKEELYFTNPSYTKEADKEAYILVFVFSGEGKSDYVLESNHLLTKIDNADVWHCIPVPLILILFLIGAGAIFGMYTFLILRKKKKLTRPPKDKEKEKKLEEEEAKKKKVIDLNTKL